MAVTLTRAQVKKLLTRTVGPLTNDELDELLDDATDQVAEWVTEATANATSSITFSQYYQNKLAKYQIQLEALSDRMSAQADREEDYSEVSPAGSQQATNRKLYVRDLDRVWAKLKGERDELLNKLGVTTEAKAIPATPGSVIRGEDDDDHDMTWTNRVNSTSAVTPKAWKNR